MPALIVVGMLCAAVAAAIILVTLLILHQIGKALMAVEIQNSAVRCRNASELVDKANGFAAEADIKMAQLTEATRNKVDKRCQSLYLIRL